MDQSDRTKTADELCDELRERIATLDAQITTATAQRTHAQLVLDALAHPPPKKRRGRPPKSAAEGAGA